MEKETRNKIQRATQAARRLLEEEYAEQLEGLHDIRLDGTIAAQPGAHLDAAQRVVRSKLVTAIDHLRAGDLDDEAAVRTFRREAAFTTLNRFVALKMLEARGLLQECVSSGENSTGFREFTGLAPGLTQLGDDAYRLYVESLFDEIGREVGVLFDRRHSASALWPRRPSLNQLLEVLNDSQLAGVWGEDETIGWVYQYFNGEDERRKMRDESQAPRNSRELAVRNQFFTPRYVVQFLVDNTLGRTWYEMMQGETGLRELDYLVRRQHETFLGEGEPVPDDPEDESLNPGESPDLPFPVRFRAKKDPRDLRVLDPACGSGHFLLYAFDLLLTLYEEAWEDPQAASMTATGRTLRDDHDTKEALRAAAPELILRHNLHGIDIDPRAVQIASLALWFRAQRAYKDLGLSRADRPAIRRTNIVVAEPMPGEEDLREAFLATLDTKLAKLFERVFDEMQLAGEAGYLLRIGEQIDDATREIYGNVGGMFHEDEKGKWSRAAQELHRALESFIAQAAAAGAFQRQLFAEDAARCLGFIEVCSQCYDVILMNPPFGAFSLGTREWSRRAYPRTKNDIYAAFVERGIELLHTGARLGAITSRTGFFLSSFQKWREEILLKEAPPVVVADLGYGVMDDAMVEAAAYCLEVLG